MRYGSFVSVPITPGRPDARTETETHAFGALKVTLMPPSAPSNHGILPGGFNVTRLPPGDGQDGNVHGAMTMDASTLAYTCAPGTGTGAPLGPPVTTLNRAAGP